MGGLLDLVALFVDDPLQLKIDVKTVCPAHICTSTQSQRLAAHVTVGAGAGLFRGCVRLDRIGAYKNGASSRPLDPVGKDHPVTIHLGEDRLAPGDESAHHSFVIDPQCRRFPA